MKSLGGAERSIMAMLWFELSSDIRRAVARPMPEEPPVISMVLGEPLRLLKAEASGWKREAMLLVFDADWTGLDCYAIVKFELKLNEARWRGLKVKIE